jgi:hypothetical protein
MKASAFNFLVLQALKKVAQAMPNGAAAIVCRKRLRVYRDIFIRSISMGVLKWQQVSASPFQGSTESYTITQGSGRFAASTLGFAAPSLRDWVSVIVWVGASRPGSAGFSPAD